MASLLISNYTVSRELGRKIFMGFSHFLSPLSTLKAGWGCDGQRSSSCFVTITGEAWREKLVHEVWWTQSRERSWVPDASLTDKPTLRTTPFADFLLIRPWISCELSQWFWKSYTWTSIRIIWELVRHADLWTPPRTYWMRDPEGGARKYMLYQVLQVILMQVKLEATHSSHC